nr:SpoIIE family protein phosphatase [candidate division Zixibacteria bacterium]
MYKLVGTDGSRFYSWLLDPGRYIIGRKESNPFCIPHKTVSRKHAELTVENNGQSFFLEDLGSRNGTAVNGKQIHNRVRLKSEDRILFGQTEFRLAPVDETENVAVAPSKAQLTADNIQNSVFMSIDEVLKPLPEKITDNPQVLSTLFEMAKTLVMSEPREIMLERSLKLVSNVIPAQRYAVLFVSGDDGEIYTAATLLPDGKDPGTFRLSRTIVNEIMNNKTSILMNDSTEDPRFAGQKSIIMSQIKSAIAVPLFDEDRVLGILYADTSNPMHEYNNDYVRVMATFGNIIGSRLLNYELLTKRQEKEILDAELRRASLIQKKLLKIDIPELAGYQLHAFQEPSLSVAGDLYDIKFLPDGHLLFMVADVSGKGMGAALLMSNILASFRILYETDNFDLARAVKSVSLQVFRHSDAGDFATLFIGLLDPKKHELRYVNAGHNPPLLVRAGGSIEHLQPGGVMIGAFDFVEWTVSEAKLSPGDLIFIFTDGVTEAQRDDEQYGDERMETIVSCKREKQPEEIVDCLMDEINKFMGEAPQSDDITILTLKRTQ